MRRHASFGEKMKTKVNCFNLLATLATLVILVSLALTNQQHVVQAHFWDALSSSLSSFSRIKPFNERHLPCPHSGWCSSRRSLKSFNAPALGRVMQLNVHAQTRPTSSLTMKTLFHIYTRDQVTMAIRFQAKSPFCHLTRLAFSRLNPQKDFQFNLTLLAESGFDITRRTVIMIPGYISLDEAEWAHAATEYWLQLLGENVNVIVVGWNDSNGPLYENAVANSVLVARQITIFLHYLAQLGGTNLSSQRFLDRIHLVGHSIGAHIAGFVGKDLGGRVGRITGLDPAGPMFNTFPLDQHLDRHDARLVDVLHTNGGEMRYTSAFIGVLTSTIPSMLASKARGQGGLFFGTNSQLGHIDYYANNGRTQDGCTDRWRLCDHARGSDVYIDLLRHELYLETMGSAWSRVYHKQNRLWAFRASDYESFKTGAELAQLCPQLVEPATHLNNTEVVKTFGQCAAPLLDVVSPVNGLIRELRHKYNINFDPDARSERQPRFYFRTQLTTEPEERPRQLVSDQHLLKIYLNPTASFWDPLLCSLQVKLRMEKGTEVPLEIDQLARGQTIIAAPFAHPAGPRAHAQLESLLAMAPTVEESGDASQVSEHFSLLFRDLFPLSVSLQFKGATLTRVPSAGTTAGDEPLAATFSSCQLAIQQVEVAPISIYSKGNLGALYGALGSLDDTKSSDAAADELKVTTTRQLTESLETSTTASSYKLTLANKYELKLQSILIAS